MLTKYLLACTNHLLYALWVSHIHYNIVARHSQMFWGRKGICIVNYSLPAWELSEVPCGAINGL